MGPNLHHRSKLFNQVLGLIRGQRQRTWKPYMQMLAYYNASIPNLWVRQEVRDLGPDTRTLGLAMTKLVKHKENVPNMRNIEIQVLGMIVRIWRSNIEIRSTSMAMFSTLK